MGYAQVENNFIKNGGGSIWIDTPAFAVLISVVCLVLTLPFLEQAGDLAVLVHVDLFGSGDLGETGHGHDVTREGHDEPGAGADLQIPHSDGEALRRTQQSGIVGQGILGLCHAHRQIAEAQIKELLGLLLGALTQRR